MSFIEAIFLGIIQGLTEFLPVSSSGHLLLFQSILRIDEPSKVFIVVVHLGTLVPVFIVYWKDIFALIKKPFQKMTLFIIVGTLPAVFVALFLGDLVDEVLAGSQYLAIGFIITGIVLIYADKVKDGNREEKDMNIIDALFVGCIQAIAITPGISRSGSTISGSLFRKVE